ncbi:MAG: AAA family ATPase [Caldilineaceae bacterium]|nr:AAA family ATPase [Caldilineaceae bacterium]
MLQRVRIQGFKSLADVEVNLQQLVVLCGPNASGKSNFLDALQLLSRIATGRTLKEAFEPPYRGSALESFQIGDEGLEGLVRKDRLMFSIKADLEISDSVADEVDRQIAEMRHRSDNPSEGQADKPPSRVRERLLRYTIEVEMHPRTGVVRVADESLVALNRNGTPSKSRRPFFERVGQRLHLRREGQAHPTYHDRYLDHSLLSLSLYPPHYPHVAAVQRELSLWMFFYFEPRERMRAANPVKEVKHIGLMGEDLAAFLNSLKCASPKQFDSVERALKMLVPNIDGIEVEVTGLGEVELRLKERGVAIPASVVSEGTLRLLGLLSLIGVGEQPCLIGFEEPENGVHPRRMELIAEFLHSRARSGKTQYIVTTHSPRLADQLDDGNLYFVKRNGQQTRIDPFRTWGPLGRREDVESGFAGQGSDLPVSERMLRGDFGGLYT